MIYVCPRPLTAPAPAPATSTGSRDPRHLDILVFRGKRQTANRKMSREHGLAVTFEPQEGLPAVSDLRQGFLPQKIVQPRV